MRKLILMAAIVAVGTPLSAQSVYHRGYVRRDGTYVQPHWQTAPNNSRADNWSTQGNVNPYNGREGTQQPYPVPTYRPYTPPPVYRPYTPPAYTAPRNTNPFANSPFAPPRVPSGSFLDDDE